MLRCWVGTAWVVMELSPVLLSPLAPRPTSPISTVDDKPHPTPLPPAQNISGESTLPLSDSLGG